MKIVEIIKSDKTLYWVALGLLGVVFVNALTDITVINGIVTILGIAFFGFRYKLK